MFSTSIIKYFGALLAAQSMAASISVPRDGAAYSAKLTRRECYDNETPALHCYTDAEDIPQDVELEDVKFVASYLRSYGRQLRDGRLFTMKAADAAGCGEWLLYARGTAAAYAKKIDLTYDSSILFEEIANAIDGGSTPDTATNLLECDYAGGSLGVQTNATAKAYSAKSYIAAGYKPQGILVKIVKA